MLRVNGIQVGYGNMAVIRDVSFRVDKGEIVTIVGSNGAGKSTILKSIVGLVGLKKGNIEFMGEDMGKYQPHERIERGIVLVPEGGKVFGRLTIKDNLYLGSYKYRKEDKSVIEERIEEVMEIFPVLKERYHSRADTMSGGERQMLAMARGLMGNPELLMLDEPSLGLAPKIVDKIFEVIQVIHSKGVPILLVEQQIHRALEIADRGYVLQDGVIVLEASGQELLNSELVKKAYLGM